MQRVSRFGIAIAVAVLAVTAGAAVRPVQEPISLPPAPTPPPQMRPPALIARASDDAPAEPLAVSRLDLRAKIAGFLARTTLVLTFRNELGRPLEGELIVPLPEGAVVSGFGLDIGGELVDGAIVEQKQARITFEKEVRKTVDPGLLEWVRGNVFRTRVWPIPAHGQRTVKIEYVSDLMTRREGDDMSALYRVPLRFTDSIPEVAVRIEVVKGQVKPEIRSGGLANLRFNQWEEQWVAETHLSDVSPKDDLVVALPEVPRQNVVVEKTENGNYYFAIDDFPPLPADKAALPPPPKRVLLLWDASLSRNQADRSRELGLLETWLQRVNQVELSVVVFRDVPEAPRPFTISSGDGRALLSFLEALPYDGGTDLAAALDSARRLKAPKAGFVFALLASDGINTLGQDSPKVFDLPLYSFTANPQADHAGLRHLAEASGGAHFDLASESDQHVLAAIGAEAFSFRQAEITQGQTADVYPRGRRPVTDRFTLCGRLLTPEATITLRYGGGAAEPVERSFTIRQSDAGASGMVPRLWAYHRVAELQIQPERNREELLELGRRFGIVTPGASLLVLETLEQHLEHRIEPPPSRARIRAEYLRRIGDEKAAAKAARKNKLDQVAALWNQRIAWWEREFKYAPDFRLKPKGAARDRDNEDDGIEGGVAGGVAGGIPGGVVGGVLGGDAERRTVAPVETPALADAVQARPAAPPPPAASAPMARSRDGRLGDEKAKQDGGRLAPRGPVIEVKPWDPDTPYLKKLRTAGPSGAYGAYLKEREPYQASPAFYLDCADYLLRNGRRSEGLRVLTSVLELKLEDARLFRVAAHRLQQARDLSRAIWTFEKVLRLRPEEPQSLRDLALALAARGEAAPRSGDRLSARAREDLRRAVQLLYEIVLGTWDSRFPEIEVVALMELNRLVGVLAADGRSADQIARVDPRLRKPIDVDLRVVMTWDTDQSDMDLWVIEPSGEKCFYSNRLTRIGGMISSDFTGGYGPEEYLVRRAQPGSYDVKANYFGSREPSLVGPTTVQATVYTNFGRPNQKRETMTLRLTGTRDVVTVGKVDFAGDAGVR